MRNISFCFLFLLFLFSCVHKLPPKDAQDTVKCSTACCAESDSKLQNFSGCRANKSNCNSHERFWLQGRIVCDPVDEQKCDGGRCCHYLMD